MATESLLKTLTKHFDSFRSGEVLSQIGALCVRGKGSRVEVLLITTRNSGRWIVPKGWPISNLAPHRVAEQEAWEEAGIIGQADKKPIGHFTYLKGLDDGRRVPSVVAVYKVAVTGSRDKFPEKGERLIAWLSPTDAAEKAESQELGTLILSLINRQKP